MIPLLNLLFFISFNIGYNDVKIGLVSFIRIFLDMKMVSVKLDYHINKKHGFKILFLETIFFIYTL